MVERSGYLNWNFNSTELFHKIVIREKLRGALRDRPDVIQVGDSSGMHGIVAGIVDTYLDGFTYANLSCCWHISLSRWLRDYLYIPLGDNQHRWLT